MKNLRTTVTWAAALLAVAPMVRPLQAQQGGIPGALVPNAGDPPTRQGTRGANWLEMPAGARGTAMGGAVASSAIGPEAWYWNPAGAAHAESFQVGGSRQELYRDLDIARSNFGLLLPALGGVVGVSFDALNSGDIPRSTEQNPYGDPVEGENFSWNSSAIGVGYARHLTDRLQLGGRVQYISEGISDASISWVGFDIGTQFRTGIYGLTIGAAVANIGPSGRMEGEAVRRRVDTDEFSNQRTSVEYETRETELPTLFRFSVGTDLLGDASSLFGGGNGANRLTGEVAFSDAIDTGLQTALGIEYGFRNLVFLRAGQRFFTDDRNQGGEDYYGLSFGGGIRVPLRSRALRLDYGFMRMGELENVQVFAIEFGR